MSESASPNSGGSTRRAAGITALRSTACAWWGGQYQPVELTTEPDGILKGYSEVLGLSLCWDKGWPRFYDPSTGQYLENWREERAARHAAESERDAAQAERDATQAENRRLRQELRRLRGES